MTRVLRQPQNETNLYRYILDQMYPFRPTQITTYLAPDIMFGLTGIDIEVDILPGRVFKTDLGKIGYPTLDQDHLEWRIAEEFKKWFDDIYVEPEENIYLGDN